MIKYGLTIYMHLGTNYDSEKVSPITLVKTSLKIARVPYDPSKTYCKTAIVLQILLMICLTPKQQIWEDIDIDGDKENATLEELISYQQKIDLMAFKAYMNENIHDEF